jgi:hypothetical protein
MAAKSVKIWYDAEGDYLEVIFERRKVTSARHRPTR